MKILEIKNSILYLRSHQLSLDNSMIDQELYDDVMCRIMYIGDGRIEVSRKIDGGLPVYYSDRNGFYLFTNISDVTSNSINYKVVNECLSNGFVFPPNTLFEGIYKLPLFCRLTVSISTNSRFEVSFNAKRCERKNENSSFSIELPAINQTSALLFSGGLDSILLALKYRTFIDGYYSTGFEFADADLLEYQYSISAANELGIKTKYKTYELIDLLMLLPEIIIITGEPVTHIQSLLLYKLIKEEVKSSYILNGQGADAIFGTYAQFAFLHNNDKNTFKKSINTCSFAEKYNGFKTDYSPSSYISNFSNFDNDVTYNALDKSFYSEMMGDCDSTMLCWSLCAQSLGKTMVYPFFNAENIHNVSCIDWRYKLREKKYILRDIARRRGVSESLILRKKGNFGPISDEWGKLLAPLLSLNSYFFEDKLIKEFSQNKDNRYVVWNAVNIIIWNLLFLKHYPIDDLKNTIYSVLKEGIK